MAGNLKKCMLHAEKKRLFFGHRVPGLGYRYSTSLIFYSLRAVFRNDEPRATPRIPIPRLLKYRGTLAQSNTRQICCRKTAFYTTLTTLSTITYYQPPTPKLKLRVKIRGIGFFANNSVLKDHFFVNSRSQVGDMTRKEPFVLALSG